MTARFQTALGTLLLLTGAIKIYMLASANSVLAVEMCSGRNLLIPTGGGGFANQLHCWGCYAAIAGAGLLLSVLFQRFRRPQARFLVSD